MVDRLEDAKLIAVCDPLLATGLMVSDEEAYEKSKSPLRLTFLDFPVLSFFTMASFIFDQLITQPVIIVGLEDIFRGPDSFDPTLRKLEETGFFDFQPDKHVPTKVQAKFHRVVSFLHEVNESTRNAELRASRQPGLAPPYEMLAYSRFTGLPFVSTFSKWERTGNRTSSELTPTRKQFEILGEVLTVELPDLVVRKLDDILEIRSKTGAREFRKFFHDFYRSIEVKFRDENDYNSADILRRWQRAKNEGIDLLAKEFKDDIKGWQTVKAGSSILLDIAGLIPIASTIAGAVTLTKDSFEYANLMARKRRAKEFAWLGFLAELRGQPVDQG